ncbi:MAG TPA: hypothetical protein VK760_09010 [Candidatus Acidoferrales bacterium]|jgi:hypothetical protein|nr:hypothetical protein [Candidatus Acidoferrales bacterium]
MRAIRFSLRGAAAVVAVAVLAACSGGSTGYAPSIDADSATGASVARPGVTFPGKSQTGVSAHYAVFRRKLLSGAYTIDVISVQEVASYQRVFRLQTARLAGAVIEYPDASTQSVDLHGEFDAGASSYAQAHPEHLNGKDVVIRVHPPKGTGLATVVTTIFAPSEAEEAKIVSGVISPESNPSDARANAAVWSCDPKDYEAKTLQVVKPNRLDGYSFAVNSEHVWYQQQFYTCGTDQASDRIPWSAARWEHISAGFGTSAHTRWSLSYIANRFYGDEVALSAKPSESNFPDKHLALIGQ